MCQLLTQQHDSMSSLISCLRDHKAFFAWFGPICFPKVKLYCISLTLIVLLFQTWPLVPFLNLAHELSEARGEKELPMLAALALL